MTPRSLELLAINALRNALSKLAADQPGNPAANRDEAHQNGAPTTSRQQRLSCLIIGLNLFDKFHFNFLHLFFYLFHNRSCKFRELKS